MKKNVIHFYIWVLLPATLLASEIQSSLRSRTELSPRLWNGSEIPPHFAPYQAFIYIMNKHPEGYLDYFCNGALISSNYVLTSAANLDGATSSYVVLGMHRYHDFGPTTIQVTTEKFILHPDYDATTLANNIGLLKLASSVRFTPCIRPIPLPTRQEEELKIGTYVAVTSWGPFALEYEIMAYNNITYCEQNHNVSLNTDVDACFAYGPCFGDSGSPIAVNGYVYGFVSRYLDCSVSYPLAIITKISYYLDWLEANTDALIV